MTAWTPTCPDPEWDVHAGASCERRIDYGDHCGPGCSYHWEPCAACRAAKTAAIQRRVAVDEKRAAEWLAGMRAREARVLQVRREMHWSAAQYPTDREQLDACRLDTGAASSEVAS